MDTFKQSSPADLYAPIIVRKEIDDEHFYYVDEVFYPSVTKILSETLPTPVALRQWLGDVGNERAQQKMETAAARGTEIHQACERLINGQEIKLISEFKSRADKKCLVGFVNWFSRYKPRPLALPNGNGKFASEMIVASRLGYAGTMDLVCEIDNQPYIVDFKTSTGIYDSHKLQITAYQHAFEEMFGIKCRRGILHLTFRNANGYTFHDDDKVVIGKKEVTIDDFVVVMNQYRMLNGGAFPEPPLVDKYPDILKLEFI